MPDTPPTPGQVCYEAYMAVHLAGDHIPQLAWGWMMLEPHERSGWDAAAQAVRMQYNAELAQAWAQGQEQRYDH